MVEILLPSSPTAFEGSIAGASDFEEYVAASIDALSTFKYSPPASLLDFLIYEKGLSSLTHFVDNKFQLWKRVNTTLARGVQLMLSIWL